MFLAGRLHGATAHTSVTFSIEGDYLGSID